MNVSIEIARKISLAYGAACKPLCRELNLPPTAFDILMFFGNNPDYKTARDVVEVRRIKANFVSINVDRLVKDGYLVRKPVKGDRRKTELYCAEKAQPVLERGRQIQNDFFEKLFADTDEETRKAFSQAMQTIEKNLDKILEDEA